MAAPTSRALLAARAVAVPRSVPIARGFVTTVRPAVPALRPVSVSLAQRYKSTERSAWAKQPIISYEELKPITQQPNDDILIVDVREPDEVALGSIPSAVNLPLSELKAALDPNFNEGEFKKKFAFSKPLPGQNIVFFCRSGKRSATASEQAGINGYGNVRNYAGSWLDWTKREKQADSDD